MLFRPNEDFCPKKLSRGRFSSLISSFYKYVAPLEQRPINFKAD